ncbi:NAD-dependent epimerase/dehydratase family protein [Dyella monticola]|uniref:NAD-dependent epimerase/dehydratase family protein n=1 Tax=Dyella monticola TaxID=1927958 RepID=A0A370X8B3_9GAMM|nr:NAD-dependent epimerase/dehydratase family protein [Dyella monticola]RDS84628.1 NAD-dependent epimerase/dehydratase family protein [Dyella monticola]
MSERILIAGCGDVGERVARLLLARGYEVYAMRRHPPEGTDAIRWLQADLTRPETLAALPGGIARVAFLPTPDARAPEAYRAVFVDGLRNLLDVLDETALRRLVFASSSAVYGEHGDAWVDETTPPAPLNFNGQVMWEAEQWLAGKPFQAVALRLAGLYGPRHLQLIDRLRAGQVRAPRTQQHWANRIHVDDAAAAIAHLLALSNPHSVYVGVDDTPLPLNVLYDDLARMVGAPPVADGPAPANVGSKRLSNARLRASGFQVHWSDARDGYAHLLGAAR